jgi:hypothetical protein
MIIAYTRRRGNFVTQFYLMKSCWITLYLIGFATAARCQQRTVIDRIGFSLIIGTDGYALDKENWRNRITANVIFPYNQNDLRNEPCGFFCARPTPGNLVTEGFRIELAHIFGKDASGNARTGAAWEWRAGGSLRWGKTRTFDAGKTEPDNSGFSLQGFGYTVSVSETRPDGDVYSSGILTLRNRRSSTRFYIGMGVQYVFSFGGYITEKRIFTTYRRDSLQGTFKETSTQTSNFRYKTRNMYKTFLLLPVGFEWQLRNQWRLLTELSFARSGSNGVYFSMGLHRVL